MCIKSVIFWLRLVIEMKVGVMQPYLFPYIGYWQLINAVDIFVIFDDVNYINKGYINRNSILIGGKENKITLELLGASQNNLINEIEIGNNCEKLLKTSSFAYKKAPHYDDAFPIIKDILENKEKNLAKFIGYSLKKIADYLDINVEFIYSSDIAKNSGFKGQDKIIEICKTLKADQYINPIGGKELYDKSAFQSKGLVLNFIESNQINYKQFRETFIPRLSIVDVMMFNAKAEIKKHLINYELV